jgi:hypothetical protein
MELRSHSYFLPSGGDPWNSMPDEPKVTEIYISLVTEIFVSVSKFK